VAALDVRLVSAREIPAPDVESPRVVEALRALADAALACLGDSPEPSLYLEHLPGGAAAFAQAIAEWLGA
jgi:hypothetical protein